MGLKATFETDIKAALLSGNKAKAEVIKSLKSAILYEEVALKVRDTGLTDEQIMTVLARESKKRAESAELYNKAGDKQRADVELAEKAIIDEYLPKQIDDSELEKVVQEAIDQIGSGAQMGQVIGAVRAKVGQGADGGRIAAMVKSKLSS